MSHFRHAKIKKNTYFGDTFCPNHTSNNFSMTLNSMIFGINMNKKSLVLTIFVIFCDFSKFCVCVFKMFKLKTFMP